MTTCIKVKQPNTKYIDCDNCSMQPVCIPLKAGKSEISIMDSYLSKRNIERSVIDLLILLYFSRIIFYAIIPVM